ncbi:MAG: hypothetical protein CME59_06565 [Halioglobus sp.]|nr:hypothetical protein [Halioglobus sp.]|tara:strand:+ start:492 stop:2780 length:2289 start_codon:yes stop_codon:yes gene_type:complete
MIKTRNTSLFLSSLVACAGAPAALVHSPLTQAANVLEEVIVTSRKRAESLQDVPIAVTAITEDTIAELRIDNIEDVAALAPNLVVNTSAGGSPSAVACMRGMCRTNTIITEDPMVGTYVNGVYLGKAVGSLVDILDLERIEILRGPQGTLFGKNTLGGAINMVTVKPGPEFEGSVNATYGNEGIEQYRAMLNVPLTDTLAGKVSYLNKQMDAVVDNPIGPDYGSTDVQAVVAALRWQPSDSVTVDYSYDYSDTGQLSGATTLSFANTPVYTDPSNPETCISGCTLIGWDIIGVDISQNVTPEFSDHYVSDGTNHDQDMDIHGHSLVAAWDISDNLTLKSISSFRDINVDYWLSYGIQIFYANRTVDTQSYSQEFHLQGLAMDSKLNYTVGVFYYSEEGEEYNSQVIPGFFADAGYDTEVDSDSYAVFGEATYDINESWDVTVGARYTYEERSADKTAFTQPDDFIFVDTYNQTYLGSTMLPDGSPVYYETDIDNDSISPRVSVSWTPRDDTMVYATYSRGYKSGGFNAAAQSPVSWEPFDDVTLDSYEIGVKATLWGGRAQLNASAFYSSADDMQVQVNRISPAGTFEAVITNAGEAEVSGLELEASVLVTDKFDIQASVGLQDADFSEYLESDEAGNEIDVSDDRVLEFTPDYTYHVGLRYQIAETSYGQWSARADFHGADNHDFQPVPFDEVAESGYDLVDARLALDNIPVGSGFVSASLWGKNLSDESYRVGGFTFTEDFGFNSYGLPRTYGVTLNYDF